MSASPEDTTTTRDEERNEGNAILLNRRCSFCDIFKTILQDKPFVIALSLIASFVIVFLIVVVGRPDLAKDVGTIWGAWIGGAIGYFFGSRPVDELIKRMDEVIKFTKGLLDEKAQQLTLKEEQLQIKTDNLMEMYQFMQKSKDELEDIENLSANYKKSVNDIREIVSKYHDKLPDDLIERLKKDYLV